MNIHISAEDVVWTKKNMGSTVHENVSVEGNKMCTGGQNCKAGS